MAQTVEEFLAQGGEIKKIDEGTRTLTPNEMYNMTSDRGITVADVDKQFGGTLSDRQLLAYAEVANES